MTTAPQSIPTRRQPRPRAHTPRPLPAWMQVGVVALLLVNGVQTALHFYSGHMAQTAPASSSNLSRFEYVYQPDRLTTAAPQVRIAYDPYARYNSGNMQPSFQYASTYFHAPGAMSVTPMRAYDMSAGRWTERDPLPAK